MQRPLTILGTRNIALDIPNRAESLSPAWRVVGFSGDTKPIGRRTAGLPVLGAITEAADVPGHAFVAASRLVTAPVRAMSSRSHAGSAVKPGLARQ